MPVLKNRVRFRPRASPLVLAGRDLVGQAQTGTGKTAAFGLPILELLARQGDGQAARNRLQNSVAAVILVPTRELAIQVADELSRFSQFLGLKTATVYGGQPYRRTNQGHPQFSDYRSHPRPLY